MMVSKWFDVLYWLSFGAVVRCEFLHRNHPPCRLILYHVSRRCCQPPHGVQAAIPALHCPLSKHRGFPCGAKGGTLQSGKRIPDVMSGSQRHDALSFSSSAPKTRRFEAKQASIVGLPRSDAAWLGLNSGEIAECPEPKTHDRLGQRGCVVAQSQDDRRCLEGGSAKPV